MTKNGKPKRTNGNALAIVTEQRRRRVRDLILEGVTLQSDLAVRLGVSGKTISQDIQWVYDQWEGEDKEVSRALKRRRIRQLELVVQKASVGYERSRQDVEEINTTYTPRECKECKGTGMVGDTTEWCLACKGEGKVMTEIMTRKVKGQAGDSSFLGRVNEAVREMCRLENHYPSYRGKGRRRSVHLHKHQHINLSGVPSEVLLEAKGVIEKLREAAGGNGRVIDVESREGEK